MSTSEPTPDDLEQQRSADPSDAEIPATSTGIEDPGTIAEHEAEASEADLVEQRQEAGTPEDER